MKIAVIAANGRTGQVFTQEALKQGHKVKAGYHRSNRLQPHPNLEIVQCDATNEADLERLINDSDVVVSLIGHSRHSRPNVQTEAIEVITKAMKKKGLKRLVSLTGTGVRFPGDDISLVDIALNMGLGLVDPKRLSDGINHMDTIRQTDLDWTVIRVLKLRSGDKINRFKLSEHGPAHAIVTRKTVAKAILKVIEGKEFIKKAPIVSKN
jgi:putative NADH-flavin reductase